MSHAAKSITTGRLERIVITHADGSRTDLGRPGTIGFRARRALYIFKLKRKGLI